MTSNNIIHNIKQHIDIYEKSEEREIDHDEKSEEINKSNEKSGDTIGRRVERSGDVVRRFDRAGTTGLSRKSEESVYRMQIESGDREGGGSLREDPDRVYSGEQFRTLSADDSNERDAAIRTSENRGVLGNDGQGGGTLYGSTQKEGHAISGLYKPVLSSGQLRKGEGDEGSVVTNADNALLDTASGDAYLDIILDNEEECT